MTKIRSFRFTIHKHEGYGAVRRRELIRVQKLLMRRIAKAARDFDGPSTFNITYTAKGNA